MFWFCCPPTQWQFFQLSISSCLLLVLLFSRFPFSLHCAMLRTTNVCFASSAFFFEFLSRKSCKKNIRSFSNRSLRLPTKIEAFRDHSLDGLRVASVGAVLRRCSAQHNATCTARDSNLCEQCERHVNELFAGGNASAALNACFLLLQSLSPCNTHV